MEKKLGSVIQELRKEKGMSQGDLAELMHISRQAISRWERDEALPDLYNLKQLSKIFNKSLDDILDNNVNPTRKKNNRLPYQLMFVSNILNIFSVGVLSIILSLFFISEISNSVFEIFNKVNEYYNPNNHLEYVSTVMFFIFMSLYILENWIIKNLSNAINLDKVKIITILLSIIKLIVLSVILFSMYDDSIILTIIYTTILFSKAILNIIASFKINEDSYEVHNSDFRIINLSTKLVNITSKVLIVIMISNLLVISLFPIKYIQVEYDETMIEEFKDFLELERSVFIDGEQITIEFSPDYKMLKVTHHVNPDSLYYGDIHLSYGNNEIIDGDDYSILIADDLLTGVMKNQIYITLKYKTFKLFNQEFYYGYNQRKFILS